MFNNGIYKDRYYPGLIDNVNNKTKKIIYFCPTILLKDEFEECIDILSKSKINFIYKFDYLKIQYIQAVIAIYF